MLTVSRSLGWLLVSSLWHFKNFKLAAFQVHLISFKDAKKASLNQRNELAWASLLFYCVLQIYGQVRLHLNLSKCLQWPTLLNSVLTRSLNRMFSSCRILENVGWWDLNKFLFIELVSFVLWMKWGFSLCQCCVIKPCKTGWQCGNWSYVLFIHAVFLPTVAA